MADAMKLLLLLSAFLTAAAKNLHVQVSNEDDTVTCGYSSCNPVKDDMINVHVVPHTHDDVGWLVTVDQYYYKNVQYILDSVIPELEKDPSKRFIYVEIAFFKRWFREQNDAMRHKVKALVNQGQLEFILGGWCMNDEAATHYNAIIDQHTLGFEYLRENFGQCGKPRVGWQIDPFGHSREQASLFAQFGFDSLFFGRLDYQDKEAREKQKTMEMIWRGSPNNLGSVADIFTGALQNNYNPPDGFCFDIFCADTIVDDKHLHDFNVNDKVDQFLSSMQSQAKHYATDHLMVTMGSDFQYQAAHNWFNNLDKLIKYVNARQANGSKVNLLYSTPSCYTYQVNKANKTWTTKEDDFFPYAHRPHSFWTGYFTSRPTLKGYVRRVNNFLQAVKQLDALAVLEDTDNSTFSVNILSEAMAVAQHHDAVSGTAKQNVTYDYEERLANGVLEGQKVFNDAVKKLAAKQGGVIVDQTFCPLLNITVCPTSENEKQFQVTVYNPIARGGLHYVRLPISGNETTAFTITDPAGKNVPYQVFTPNLIFPIPERKNDSSQSELIFPVTLVPLGWAVYTVAQKKAPAKLPLQKRPLVGGEDWVIKNEYMSLAFDFESGLLKNITNLEKNVSINVTQNFAYYNSHPGNNSTPELQASGAYIFRPDKATSFSFPAERAKLSSRSYFVQGTLVQEVYQEFADWIALQIRLYSQQRFAEFLWTVGPIPIDDGIGKEIVSVFSTSMANKGTFYTDANGREILKRQLDHRDTWTFNNTEPYAGNYYPVNSRIYMRDESSQLQFTVLTDRSQGGSSLREGQMELMVHRRLLHDDSLGVAEALNETGSDGKGLIARGSHYLMLEPIASSAARHRDLAERLYMAPQLSFAAGAPQTKAGLSWSGVQHALPDNVHLLTLQQFPAYGPAPSKSQPFLLRLEHFYEKDEDPDLSKPATVDLQTLFSAFTITEAVELTLGGDMVLSDLHRLHWNYPLNRTTPSPNQQDTDSVLRFQPMKSGPAYDLDPTPSSLNVTLNPMQIRTFQISIESQKHTL